MSLSTRVKVTGYLITAIYGFAFLVYGVTLSSQLSRVLSFVPLGVVAIFAVFDNLLWRIGSLPHLLRQPVLRGTWYGRLKSFRRDEADRRITSTHEVFLVVQQSLTSLSVTMLTAESKSRSATAELVRMQTQDYVLRYQYQNDPQLHFRRRGSTIHVGGAAVQVGGVHPRKLDGEYWTARDTCGEFRLDLLSDHRVATFNEGQHLRQEVSRGLG